jgi:hypothetical protein
MGRVLAGSSSTPSSTMPSLPTSHLGMHRGTDPTCLSPEQSSLCSSSRTHLRSFDRPTSDLKSALVSRTTRTAYGELPRSCNLARTRTRCSARRVPRRRRSARACGESARRRSAGRFSQRASAEAHLDVRHRVVRLSGALDIALCRIRIDPPFPCGQIGGTGIDVRDYLVLSATAGPSQRNRE